jgi:MOSC domain-containing protein YiiM
MNTLAELEPGNGTAVAAGLRIAHIYISPGHNFFGHHGRPAGRHPAIAVAAAECIAGRGLRGDRFCDAPAGGKGQLTLFSAEVFARLCNELGLRGVAPHAMRRNVIVGGADLNALVGVEFELQGVRLRGVEECRPCRWMDEALAPGAEAWLRGRGGLRCQILTNGWLRTGESGAR